MSKIKTAIKWLICDRSDGAMVCRTVIEAVLSYLTAHIAEIAELIPVSPEARSLAVGLFMVVYTTLMSSIRKVQEKKVS